MISIIIPTYNEEKNIEIVLKAFQRQTVPRSSFEIIIVDGQSKDKTAEIAKNYADKVIQQASKGVGGARNDGARIARGRIIATTDADCLPSTQWLETIGKSFKYSNIKAATGILKPILPSDMNIIQYLAYKILIETSNVLILIGAKLRFYHLCGANSAFDREAFLGVGGYSDLPYSDDVEIVRRISSLGRIIVDKDIYVNYSVRRILKLGLIKYSLMILRNDWAIMFFNYRPKKDDYAKQTYN